MKQTLLNQEFPSPLKRMAREILTAGHGGIINVRTILRTKGGRLRASWNCAVQIQSLLRLSDMWLSGRFYKKVLRPQLNDKLYL